MLVELGRPEEALDQLDLIARRQKNFAGPMQVSAWLLATHPDDTLRNGARAVSLAEQAAFVLGRPDPGLLDVLAAAYAEAGRRDDAVAAARQALELALRSDSPHAAGIRQRLELYEQGQAYRDPRGGLPPFGALTGPS